MMRKSSSRFSIGQFILVLLSVSCEYYLFTLFIVLAPQISHDLIPIADIEWREWFGLSIFLIAGFCRPLGGIFFSGLGDSPHRYRIFFISTLVMSLSSILLGFLPSAADIGIFAPLVLLFIRIAQGLVVGAAVPEAMIYCYDTVTPRFRVLTTGLINIACSFGFVIAIIFTIISHGVAGKESWRIGMVGCGVFNLVIGYFLRNSFQGCVEPIILNYGSLKKVLKSHKLNLLRLIGFAAFLSSGMAVFIYFMPNYLYDYFHFTKLQTHIVNLFEIAGYIIGQLVAAFFHERLSKNFYILAGFLFKGLLVFTFHSYVRHSLMEAVLLNAFCCFCFGFFVAKLPVLMVSSFPRRIGFAGVAIVYNISFGVMFGITQYAITWLIHETKSLYMPSVYIVFFSYVSLISLWFMSKDIFYKYYR